MTCAAARQSINISAPAGSRVPSSDGVRVGPTKARPHHICRNHMPFSGCPLGGGVAPGAGAGGADGADLEPVLRAAGQAGDGAARGFAGVTLRPGSAGRDALLGDAGLDAAPEGVPGEVHSAFEVAAGGDEVRTPSDARGAVGTPRPTHDQVRQHARKPAQTSRFPAQPLAVPALAAPYPHLNPLYTPCIPPLYPL